MENERRQSQREVEATNTKATWSRLFSHSSSCPQRSFAIVIHLNHQRGVFSERTRWRGVSLKTVKMDLHRKLTLLTVILRERVWMVTIQCVTLANVQGKRGPKIELDPWENSDIREISLVDDLSCTSTVLPKSRLQPPAHQPLKLFHGV